MCAFPIISRVGEISCGRCTAPVALTAFLPSLLQCSQRLRYKNCAVPVSLGSGPTRSSGLYILIVWHSTIVSDYCKKKKKAPLMRRESYTYVWKIEKIFKMKLESILFKRILVISSPLRIMTS